MPEVAILMGSKSDTSIAEKTSMALEEAGIAHEMRVISAHRNPDELDEYVRNSDALLFIAIAGLSAALPGAIAARTRKPVIGVPVSTALGGLDALLSIAQMPPGVPVACVGIDNGVNAARLAERILQARD
ncbi:5-(carboxyamino)imidazole ribonucleotide mutase [Methanosarcinales archaeon ex4572_44]|nr:MAG: 5-(carboxyamino)imidazole ribonucleotide mutase [Methanosarcinales archaeon ex4484_138]PHP46146.1 MAG: 5-(carboxyamino)imidazole ribonucleotide mutase [Methanosarcinales archaeon ex4572_44]RLG25548.1 MAG: 5-(carboxyamino)imidazole ribonucleotide mutase [Methanosarcinales archaeon]